jgi:hypothetical protein
MILQSEGVSEAREDRLAYCPRVDAEILILSGRCFFPGRNKSLCSSCIYDVDFVAVQLLLLLADNLNMRAKGAKQG